MPYLELENIISSKYRYHIIFIYNLIIDTKSKFMRKPVCLSVYLSVCLSVCMCVCLSVCQSVLLCVRLSLSPFYLIVHLDFSLSIYLTVPQSIPVSIAIIRSFIISLCVSGSFAWRSWLIHQFTAWSRHQWRTNVVQLAQGDFLFSPHFFFLCHFFLHTATIQSPPARWDVCANWFAYRSVRKRQTKTCRIFHRSYLFFLVGGEVRGRRRLLRTKHVVATVFTG